MARGKVHMNLYKSNFVHTLAFILLEAQIIRGEKYVAMRDIYRTLGITKQTFYNHLQNVRVQGLMDICGITGARMGKMRYFSIDINKYGLYLSKLSQSTTK